MTTSIISTIAKVIVSVIFQLMIIMIVIVITAEIEEEIMLGKSLLTRSLIFETSLVKWLIISPVLRLSK